VKESINERSPFSVTKS